MIWKTVLVVLAVGALAESYRVRRSDGTDDKKTASDLGGCFSKVFDTKTIKRELDEAVAAGTVKTVFQKYCPKSDQIKTCFREMFAVQEMPKFLKDNLPNIYNSSDEAIDWICYNDGERFDSFINEGGYRCVEQQYKAIRQCGSSSDYAETAGTPNNQEVHCKIFDDIQTCVIHNVETCSSPAAVSVIQSLFGFARKAHTCT